MLKHSSSRADASCASCLQTYSQLAHPIQQAKAAGLKFHSKILDIDNIDVNLLVLVCFCCLRGRILGSRSDFSVVSVSQLAMGKMMDQGPVLIITFQAQLVMVIRNAKGEVVEGDPVGWLVRMEMSAFSA